MIVYFDEKGKFLQKKQERIAIYIKKLDSIIYLSKSFEILAQYCCPKAFYHCVEIGVHPLSIVFPWIFTAFSGYLQINETLYLCDRILSYDSLELLSILSAAIFGFRQKDILKATNEQQIYVLFADIRGLKVIPILQHFLFSNH
ncbi:TBC1 domain family member 19 [Reticulomyxa filosa]|uniref:TBC1 domain family member 19 n=1 Tax=Reticulomyxa filosa TaxID=46433 RepID=X6LUF9_RETFI|nr:TBC1 domain family member 19 [Reticulomyxa filosa]|eukprot:ETO04350.1 TBC1 domain family member 19 [Reticulomyxa filosa]